MCQQQDDWTKFFSDGRSETDIRCISRASCRTVMAWRYAISRLVCPHGLYESRIAYAFRRDASYSKSISTMCEAFSRGRLLTVVNHKELTDHFGKTAAMDGISADESTMPGMGMFQTTNRSPLSILVMQEPSVRRIYA